MSVSIIGINRSNLVITDRLPDVIGDPTDTVYSFVFSSLSPRK